MKRRMLITAVGIVLVAAAVGAVADVPEPGPRIQLAILLDTSSSMSGLIAQAKTQLWKIVNEFATTRKNGVIPRLEVALYEYGNSGLKGETGWIRQVLSLTNDLDSVSEQLFALRTGGGSEYCGMVIKRAIDDLSWSKGAEDLKVIVIAGNEPFTQGTVLYEESCKTAISNGIVVNTIFCGNHDQGVNTKWKHGADLADGAYASIDQNKAVAAIKAPQDADIARLGSELNRTYIAYGARGQSGAANQAAQDANASVTAPGAMAERAVAKASVHYRAAEWDLVDAVKEGKLKADEVKEEDLPEPMKKMTSDERKAYIEKQALDREKIQKEIGRLNVERQKFITEEQKKQAGGADTFDAALIKALREQAAKRNFATN